MNTLAPLDQRGEEDIEELRSRAAELEAAVQTRDGELGRVRSEIDRFRMAYHQQVGTLHQQLDQIELAIAEAELGELSKLVDDRVASPGAQPAGDGPSSPPRFTSDAVRKLFRDVAKAIHPDLAHDEEARSRRHALMIEANKAYAMGDGEQLRHILAAWERSPEAVQGSDRDAARARLTRRIAQLEEQVTMLARDLEELRSTPLWQLKAMVDEAAAKGKDLVGDMVKRLKRDIMVASNRLDAMRPPG